MKRIAFDYTHLVADVAADFGLSHETIAQATARALAGVDTLAEFGSSGETTFLSLPEIDTTAIEERAAADRAAFTDLVVLGIGGSSLGARAVYSALTRPHSGRHVDGSQRDGLRLHFVENVDPVDVVDLLDSLDLKTTVFNVVTKSGGTIETMSAFFIARQRLIDAFGVDGYRARMVATTDPRRGALRNIVREDGLFAFDVPPAVGGRFSVLTPVGLYPLAAAGLDIRALLAGAAAARDAAYRRSVDDNVAAMFALTQIALYEQGVHDVVFMPYANGLRDTAAWFVQLWAESLGKLRHTDDGVVSVGPTPIAALGATDQHSQLQLYMEGPPTKNIVFVDAGAVADDPSVPAAREVCESLRHLGGKKLGEILHAELRGVRAGLAEVGRPTSTLRLRDVSPDTIGALLMTLECAVSIAGAMLGIDPYNQPGVELGKRYAHGLLGRDKEQHYAERIQAQSRDISERVASF